MGTSVSPCFKECLVLIETVLAEFNGMCEYPIYIKAGAYTRPLVDLT